jgi:hypothetical protein
MFCLMSLVSKYELSYCFQIRYTDTKLNTIHFVGSNGILVIV